MMNVYENIELRIIKTMMKCCIIVVVVLEGDNFFFFFFLKQQIIEIKAQGQKK